MKKILLFLTFALIQCSSDGQCWKSIASGSCTSVAISNNGKLYETGYKLGTLHAQEYELFFQAIGKDSDWNELVMQLDHALILKTNGTLWAYGGNEYGQIGNGTTINQSIPVLIDSTTNWLQLSAGQFCSAAIRNDGTLWTWGNNEWGQLGSGNLLNILTPMQVGIEKNWNKVAIASPSTYGNPTSYAIKKDGTLWAWGANNWDAIGHKNKQKILIPQKICSENNWTSVYNIDNFCYALNSNGELWSITYKGQILVEKNKKFKKICPTQIGFFALNEDGTLWLHGDVYGLLNFSNSDFLNIFNKDTNWIDIAAGKNTLIGLNKNNTISLWGTNSCGQLGDGTKDNRKIPNVIGCQNIDGSWSFYDGTTMQKKESKLISYSLNKVEKESEKSARLEVIEWYDRTANKIKESEEYGGISLLHSLTNTMKPNDIKLNDSIFVHTFGWINGLFEINDPCSKTYSTYEERNLAGNIERRTVVSNNYVHYSINKANLKILSKANSIGIDEILFPIFKVENSCNNIFSSYKYTLDDPKYNKFPVFYDNEKALYFEILARYSN